MSVLGVWTIRLTIWLAVAAWLTRVFAEILPSGSSQRDRLIHWAWLVGAFACLAHVIAAMGFGHCWSLMNAMRHTAMQTRQVIGIELPWSVFANFAFVGLWLIDAMREFFRASSPLRSLGFARHAIWAMMMINGTVVFGPSYWKWLAGLVVIGLIGATLIGWHRQGCGNKNDSMGSASPQ